MHGPRVQWTMQLLFGCLELDADFSVGGQLSRGLGCHVHRAALGDPLGPTVCPSDLKDSASSCLWGESLFWRHRSQTAFAFKY